MFLSIGPKKTKVITTIKKAEGREVIISSFCTASSTSISGFTLPKRMMAKVASKIKMDHSKRCSLWGCFALIRKHAQDKYHRIHQGDQKNNTGEQEEDSLGQEKQYVLSKKVAREVLIFGSGVRVPL